MAKFNQDVPQFGSAKPANMGGSQHCAQCEAMLADALDGTLSATEQAQFDAHMAGCSTCSVMLADAQRGAAWLEMLRTPRPEPPTALLERILAQTGTVQNGEQTGTAAAGSLSIMPAPSALTATGDRPGLPQKATVLPFRTRVSAILRGKGLGQSMLQPRLAMTAAMAFFSVGLTLNLTGVHLNELRASDLKPVNLRRSFYQANAHVARYYDNLRVVYELESRVRDLQHGSDDSVPVEPESSDKKTAPVPSPGTKPGGSGQPEQKQSQPKPNSGTSRRQAAVSSSSLLAVYRANATESPLRRFASLSPVRFSLITMQEGEIV